MPQAYTPTEGQHANFIMDSYIPRGRKAFQCLSIQPRLTSNSWQSCFCLMVLGIQVCANMSGSTPCTPKSSLGSLSQQVSAPADPRGRGAEAENQTSVESSTPPDLMIGPRPEPALHQVHVHCQGGVRLWE